MFRPSHRYGVLALACALLGPVPSFAGDRNAADGLVRDIEERRSDREREREDVARTKTVETTPRALVLRVELIRFDLEGAHPPSTVRGEVEKALRRLCRSTTSGSVELAISGHISASGSFERVRVTAEGHAEHPVAACVQGHLERARVASAAKGSAFEATGRYSLTAGEIGGAAGATVSASGALGRERPRFARCRRDAVDAGTNVPKTVRLVFSLAPSGTVLSPHLEPASFANTTLERCVVEVLERLTFAPFDADGPAPVTFRPFEPPVRRPGNKQEE